MHPVHSFVINEAVPPGLYIRLNLIELIEVMRRECWKNFLVIVGILLEKEGCLHSIFVSDRQRKLMSCVTVDCRISFHLLKLC